MSKNKPKEIEIVPRYFYWNVYGQNYLHWLLASMFILGGMHDTLIGLSF